MSALPFFIKNPVPHKCTGFEFVDYLKFQNKVVCNGGCETPAGKARRGETSQAQGAEEASGPPAESECLEFKSSFEFYKPS
ncbi:hypothetical protein COF64_09405 [Bacillus sp. AFS043905]|nr:hypothetical protein COF64_09405 [Bacillus sp. AFS043905]